MSNHIRKQPLSRTRAEKAFDRAAEKAYRKNVAKVKKQHKAELENKPFGIFKGPLY